jgi:hypothetical protein
VVHLHSTSPKAQHCESHKQKPQKTLYENPAKTTFLLAASSMNIHMLAMASSDHFHGRGHGYSASSFAKA